jgi:hypothetical protein
MSRGGEIPFQPRLEWRRGQPTASPKSLILSIYFCVYLLTATSVDAILQSNSKESAMLNHTNKVRLIIGASVLLAAVTFLGTAASQKASAPKPQDRLTLGEEHVKQLLLLMDTDKNGMVSKQEYMHFMEAEFQRLDKSHEGQLNARQLNQSTVSASRFTGK